VKKEKRESKFTGEMRLQLVGKKIPKLNTKSQQHTKTTEQRKGNTIRTSLEAAWRRKILPDKRKLENSDP